MTDHDEPPTVGQRLADVLNELGIERAHIATGGIASEGIYELIRQSATAPASLTFINIPPVLDAEVLRPLADRMLCVGGSQMDATRARAREEMESWGGTIFTELPADYAAELWSDIVHDNVGIVVHAIGDLVGRVPEVPTVALSSAEGVLHGIRYRIVGEGPPLLLFPIELAPTQWDAAIPELSKRFTTIRLGGAHLGAVQGLDQRYAIGTYRQGVRSLFDLMEIGPGQRVLEVGVGSGAVVRDLATRPNAPAEIVAVDINEYLLDEARALAAADGAGSSIDFRYGNAEDLPFEDNSFDVAYSVTVFEECDAERGIAELHRVLKPGGRAGVIVRSDDLPFYWNIDVSDEIARKINVPISQQVTRLGCVDASLYPRFAQHFSDLKPNPFWFSLAVEVGNSALWANRARAELDSAEIELFDLALGEERSSGAAFVSKPFHSVVGTKPER